MPWGVAAAAVVGAAASSKAASAAADASNRATDASASAAADELEWAKQQQDDWDEIFGPTQENLAEYYNNLDPDIEANKKIMVGLENLQQGHQDYTQQLEKSMAQRGMGGSGLEVELANQAQYQTAANKANLITDATVNAERDVAEQQMGFLGVGLGQQSIAQSNIANAYNTQNQVAGQGAISARSDLAAANQGFGKSLSSVGQAVGYAVGSGKTTNSSISNVAATAPYKQYSGGPTWGNE